MDRPDIYKNWSWRVVLKEAPVHGGTGEVHTSLLLLQGNTIKDKIHFDNVSSRLSLISVGSCLGKKDKSKGSYSQLYFMGVEGAAKSFWKKLKDSFKEVDRRYFYSPDEFNCRAGVVATLRATDLVYIMPVGMEKRSGMDPDFSKQALLPV